MSDLAQALIDAAAKAVHERDPEAMHSFEDEGPRYIEAGRAAVVAVLEALADAERTYGVGTLEDLAAEVWGDRT